MNMVENNLGYGFFIISVLCVICGRWISIPPIRIGPSNICYYILQMHSFIIMFLFTMICTFAVYSLQAINISNDFTMFIYLFCAFIGQMECCLRGYFIFFNKNNIEKLFYSLEKFIANETKLKKYQSKVIKRLTRHIISMLVIFSTAYSFALLCNYLTFKKEIDNIRSDKNVTSNSTIEERHIKSYIQNMQSFVNPSISTLVYFDFMYIFGALGILFLIVSDVLFYSIYWLIISELGVLNEVLAKYINDKDKMDWWVKSHHLLMR